jgi:ADP-ribose pyrophosphatase YjhB (NUDIX family)
MRRAGTWAVPGGFQEHVLRGVFGIMHVPEHIAAQVVYLVLVGEDELAECRGVAVLESVYTIEVVRVLHQLIIAEETINSIFFLRRCRLAPEPVSIPFSLM